MIDIIKEAFNIDFHHPVKLPAAFPRLRNRLVCGFTRSITIRVCMEQGFQYRLVYKLPIPVVYLQEMALPILQQSSHRHCRPWLPPHHQHNGASPLLRTHYGPSPLLRFTPSLYHFSAFPRSFPSERCRNSDLYATLMFSDQTAPV